MNRKAFCFLTFDTPRRIERVSQPPQIRHGEAICKTVDFYRTLIATQLSPQPIQRPNGHNSAPANPVKASGPRKRGRPPGSTKQHVELSGTNSQDAATESPKRGRRRKE